MPMSEIQTVAPARGLAVIAPSSAALDDSVLERGLQHLAQQGFAVHNYYRPDEKFQRFGASDAQRVRQIQAAASNPEVDIVMGLRGGYGLSRLLPYIHFETLAASGKCFCGYSDFTVLHMGLLKHGRVSLAGPMVCDDYTREQPSPYTLNQFAACLQSTRHSVAFDAPDCHDAEVRGVLWGGNLAMLAHLAGTPYLPQMENGILFVEDIGEHPYRVERMILQLFYAGLLKSQKALVLGDFSAYTLAAHDNGYGFEQMVHYLRATLPLPVFTGLPFGHRRDRATLVVGSQASLHVQGGKAVLEMQYQL